MTWKDLLINLHKKTVFPFGLLEGYQVLYDRGGLRTLLSIKRKEIEEGSFFDKEAQTWFEKRVMLVLRQSKTS